MQLYTKILISFLLLSISITAFGNNTVYLTRHAEKVANGKNPELTEAGKQRANNIAIMLSSAGITEIYSSNYKRTLQTAEPLAQLLNLKIKLYDPSKLADFAKLIKQKNGGVLVVGHSNTTPELAHLLSDSDISPMKENDYGTIYQIISVDNHYIVNELKSISSEKTINANSGTKENENK